MGKPAIETSTLNEFCKRTITATQFKKNKALVEEAFANAKPRTDEQGIYLPHRVARVDEEGQCNMSHLAPDEYLVAPGIIYRRAPSEPVPEQEKLANATYQKSIY